MLVIVGKSDGTARKTRGGSGIRGRLWLRMTRSAGIARPVARPQGGPATASVALGHRILDRASLLVVLKGRDREALVLGSARRAVTYPLE